MFFTKIYRSITFHRYSARYKSELYDMECSNEFIFTLNWDFDYDILVILILFVILFSRYNYMNFWQDIFQQEYLETHCNLSYYFKMILKIFCYRLKSLKIRYLLHRIAVSRILGFFHAEDTNDSNHRVHLN